MPSTRAHPNPNPDEPVSHRARRALVVAAALTAVVPLVPFASTLLRPFVWLQTFAHESGHALTALLLAHADRVAVRVFADGSGIAPWHASVDVAPWQEGAIAIGGLVGPACAAALFFVAARRPRIARAALALLAAACAAAACVVVENVFGRVAVGAWALVLGACAWQLAGARAQVACAFAGVDLGLSVFSRADYLFTRVAHTADGDLPSDVANVAASLGGFFWVWGAVIGALSVVVVAAGLFVLTRGSRSPS